MSRDVAKVTLDLDDAANDPDRSILDLSLADGIEDEKCVVSQYRTTRQQKQALQMLVKASSSREEIPVEWVIDIADESNGWFYATAYHFDDVNQMLHVMVPDKENPTFDGKVQLDHRTVHLIECVDNKSMALFNKIIRDSVQKIKWDVEWFEENENGNGNGNNGEGQQQGQADGSWILSSARYYIRMANQLLVEDKDAGADGARGFVIITADMNVKLVKCHKGRGLEDFYRLVNEGIVMNGTGSDHSAFMPPPATSSTNNNNTVSSAAEAGVASSASKHSNNNQHSNSNNHHNNNHQHDNTDDRSEIGSIQRGKSSNSSSSSSSSTRKLAEIARLLKENVLDLVNDREKKKEEEMMYATSFAAFALDGDLDEGLKLLSHFEQVKDSEKKKQNNNKQKKKKDEDNDDEDDNNGGEDGTGDEGEENNEEKKMIIAANDARYLSEKLEKYLVKLLKAGRDLSPTSSVSNLNSGEDVENLKKTVKKLKRENEEREREIRQLRQGSGGGR